MSGDGTSDVGQLECDCKVTDTVPLSHRSFKSAASSFHAGRSAVGGVPMGEYGFVCCV